MRKYDKYTNEYKDVKLVAKKESKPFEMKYTIWIDGKRCDLWGNPIIEGLPKPTFNLYEVFKRGKTTKEVMDTIKTFDPNLTNLTIAVPYEENKEQFKTHVEAKWVGEPLTITIPLEEYERLKEKNKIFKDGVNSLFEQLVIQTDNTKQILNQITSLPGNRIKRSV